jgi:hypothetical protein
MQLNHITEFVIYHLFSRLLRRAIGAVLLVLFTLVAAYHFTIAGTLVLEGLYGMLYARLIIAAIYLAAASILLIVLVATRARPLIKNRAPDAGVSSHDPQIAALVEAAMFGYAMARKSADRIR